MKTSLLTLVLLAVALLSSARQNEPAGVFMFYNVENLFDTEDDPQTADEEFTPSGDRHWTNLKFINKVSKIAKVIIAAGKWSPPDIVGLCEIENRGVVGQLIAQPALKNLGYKIIHKESPDRRGIDVAIIYREGRIHPLKYECLEVKDKGGGRVKTREILYFSYLFGETDTFHLFINHWPSRYRGFLETIDARENAARVLKKKVGELFQWGDPKVIIMGDFNDQPTDDSVSKVLGAGTTFQAIGNNKLYNLSSLWKGVQKGTLKFHSQWSAFDQVIVSGALLNKTGRFYCNKEDAHIFDPAFLLEKDERYGGVKPNRTYIGFKYHGGFSDHLPVYLNIREK
ncbi:MAG: endonuclease [Chlorobi bacterium]|nr:endonuclease [Chlorobiota bacterium]